MKCLAFIFGRWVYYVNSIFIRTILRLRGINIGKALYIQGIPRLKIKGKARNIKIGSNVTINGDIDLRNRENGKIVIGDNCSFDENCRFVAANNATLKINSNTAMGPYCIINAGEDVTIGDWCLFSGDVYINSSDHNLKKGEYIRKQGYHHSKIIIEDDCFFGGHVSILQGVHIKKGAVIGANAVVTKDLPPYSISVGIPARVIKYRK